VSALDSQRDSLSKHHSVVLNLKRVQQDMVANTGDEPSSRNLDTTRTPSKKEFLMDLQNIRGKKNFQFLDRLKLDTTPSLKS